MTLTHLLILLLVGAVVGVIAERLVNRWLPYGWIGASVAGLLGAWLMTDAARYHHRSPGISERNPVNLGNSWGNSCGLRVQPGRASRPIRIPRRRYASQNVELAHGERILSLEQRKKLGIRSIRNGAAAMVAPNPLRDESPLLRKRAKYLNVHFSVFSVFSISALLAARRSSLACFIRAFATSRSFLRVSRIRELLPGLNRPRAAMNEQGAPLGRRWESSVV